jgi:hypothetical protein
VEFDGHALDGLFTIKLKNIYGDDFTEVIGRIWLLVIIDIVTRTIQTVFSK